MGDVEHLFEEEYVATWTAMLGAFFDWSEQRISAWIQDFYADRKDLVDSGLLYHEEPVYWLLPLLIPDALETKVVEAGSYVALEEALQEAILEVIGKVEIAERQDWFRAKARAEDVIRQWCTEYDLPRADQEIDE
jgi:hypothetical protein